MNKGKVVLGIIKTFLLCGEEGHNWDGSFPKYGKICLIITTIIAFSVLLLTKHTNVSLIILFYGFMIQFFGTIFGKEGIIKDLKGDKS
jgi:hypothetical protein